MGKGNQLLRMLLVVALAFLLHIFVLYLLELPLWDNLIVMAYSINAGLAFGIYLLLAKAKKRFESSLGFLFLGSSALKFAVFFIFFYPSYNADGDLQRLEFLTFFIPYGICLALETRALIKLLSQGS